MCDDNACVSHNLSSLAGLHKCERQKQCESLPPHDVPPFGNALATQVQCCRYYSRLQAAYRKDWFCIGSFKGFNCLRMLSDEKRLSDRQQCMLISRCVLPIMRQLLTAERVPR